MATPKRRKKSAVREARSAAIRGALVGAATAIAGREGLQGVTIRGVAKAAGCSVSSVYAYFEDRDAILEAMVDASIARIAEGVHKPCPPGASFDEKMDLLLARLASGPQHFPQFIVDLEFPRAEYAALSVKIANARLVLFREWLEANATPADLGGHTYAEAAATLLAVTRAFGSLALHLGADWISANAEAREVIRAVLAWARVVRKPIAEAPDASTGAGRS